MPATREEMSISMHVFSRSSSASETAIINLYPSRPGFDSISWTTAE
jgi:hypothetical protein